VLTRLVLQPALLTAGVALALRLRLFAAPDPMFLLTLLLANATPSAINLQTVTVLYNHGHAEMGQLLFWQYLLAVVTLPCFTFIFLHIIAAFPPTG
jgi:predicted permease